MSSKDKTYPLMLNYIPEECIKVAQKELHEIADKTEHLIGDLRKMLKAERTLSDIEFHSDFLLQFLRVSKFNVEVAFKRLYKYTTMRRKISSFFTGVQDRISTSPAYKWVSPLPWRSYDGSAIFLAKFGSWNNNDISYEHVNRIVHVVIHQLLRNPVNQIKGFRVILDFENTCLRQLKYATPSNALQVAQMYLECTPARFKGFHMINSTLPMKIAYSAIYPFLTEKLKKRVSFHKDVKELLEYFPKCTLPVEYGGDLKDYYMYSWMKEANDQMGISTLCGQRNIF